MAPDTGYGFALDPFQRQAIAALDDGRHVVVAAPTGSGKTVVAEHGIERAGASGRRAFYTAPLKALSNQKFTDFRQRYGADQVGLLTGDNSIDGDAPIVVMTTEVLRNMIYAQSAALDALGLVVLDEVHFLQDAYRGPVWEEVIIHLPTHVQLVCLSATVSNAAELAEWIETVRGPTTVVVETKRPVALVDHYLVGDRTNERLHLLPTFVDGSPNPAAARLDGSALAPRRRRGHRDARTGRDGRGQSGATEQAPSPRSRGRGTLQNGARVLYTPTRAETLGVLERHDMLPAIVFIFSRNQCEEAARSVVNAGVRMTTGPEREAIRAVVDERLDGIGDGDLAVLGYGELLAQLEAGVAPHHAGMVPAFKEVVERCFTAGLLKAVFATETLAVGVNMPARSVVIEKLTKFTGDHHEMLTPGEYTQLTGRAGRRGLDPLGEAVVLWSPFVSFDRVALLASSRSFHLRSAFRPTYNMAANLVRTHTPAEAAQLLNLSFAQFQSDRDVVSLQARAERLRGRVADARRRAESPFGDIWEYRARRRRLEERVEGEFGAQRREEALARLRPGDIVIVRRGRYEGAAALVASSRRKGGVRLTVITDQSEQLQVGSDDVIGPAQPVGHVRLPGPYQGKDKNFRRTVGRAVAAATINDPRQSRRHGRQRGHRHDEPAVDPLEHDPDLHERMKTAGHAERLQRDLDETEARIDDHHRTLGAEFDAVIDVLRRRGYIDISETSSETDLRSTQQRGRTGRRRTASASWESWTLTARGRRLTRLFHESDLLIAEALNQGLLSGDRIDAPALAGLLALFVYEHRSPEPPPPPWFPSADLRRRANLIAALSDDLAADERARGLSVHRPPDPGFFAAAQGWIAGHDLATIVDDELTGGDFVRTMKQLLDLARQIAEIAPDEATRDAAAEIVATGRRGVVGDTLAEALTDDAPDDGDAPNDPGRSLAGSSAGDTAFGGHSGGPGDHDGPVRGPAAGSTASEAT